MVLTLCQAQQRHFSPSLFSCLPPLFFIPYCYDLKRRTHPGRSMGGHGNGNQPRGWYGHSVSRPELSLTVITVIRVISRNIYSRRSTSTTSSIHWLPLNTLARSTTDTVLVFPTVVPPPHQLRPTEGLRPLSSLKQLESLTPNLSGLLTIPRAKRDFILLVKDTGGFEELHSVNGQEILKNFDDATTNPYKEKVDEFIELERKKDPYLRPPTVCNLNAPQKFNLVETIIIDLRQDGSKNMKQYRNLGHISTERGCLLTKELLVRKYSSIDRAGLPTLPCIKGLGHKTLTELLNLRVLNRVTYHLELYQNMGVPADWDLESFCLASSLNTTSTDTLRKSGIGSSSAPFRKARFGSADVDATAAGLTQILHASIKVRRNRGVNHVAETFGRQHKRNSFQGQITELGVKKQRNWGSILRLVLTSSFPYIADHLKTPAAYFVPFAHDSTRRNEQNSSSNIAAPNIQQHFTSSTIMSLCVCLPRVAGANWIKRIWRIDPWIGLIMKAEISSRHRWYSVILYQRMLLDYLNLGNLKYSTSQATIVRVRAEASKIVLDPSSSSNVDDHRVQTMKSLGFNSRSNLEIYLSFFFALLNNFLQFNISINLQTCCRVSSSGFLPFWSNVDSIAISCSYRYESDF
ncbi:uncharacterized protein BDR25DRAFT_351887 [Lindgomyces ingoldianus]|uniref:Uncharacterized protein n=1 Tax=Lindgomyces ingoldianus TaxID=673940 RepID=A0ACB6R668_9PLEO|nr:uncharacterized protein BDR25DRAFT_351887 [Lindgomyces ingoldianus]KAF2474338.1 hypothetical protein BDR25DRAFT_351887 [Lindgomyces ingoldianus]